MTSIGVRTAFKTQLAQKHEEINVVKAIASVITSSAGNNLTLTSSSGNNILLNNQISATSSGNLELTSKLVLIDRANTNYERNLYNDGNNLIWGSDVIVTDATIESEVEGITNIDISTITVSGTISGLPASSGLVISGKTTLNSKVYTWPSTSGSSNNILTTNGTGTLSWSPFSTYELGGLGDVTLTSPANNSLLKYDSSNSLWIDSKVINIDTLTVNSGATLPQILTIGSVAHTFPSSGGTTGQVMQTNGSGTLTWATVSGTLDGATDSSFSSIATNDLMKYNGTKWVNSKTVSITTLTATTLNGTLGTAAQTNVTSLGTLTGLTAAAEATINGTPAIGGQLHLTEGTNNGSNKITFQAPASLSANYSLIFPANDGDANEFLQSDGSGNLTWASATSTIAAATDTNISTPSANQLLAYNNGTSKWDNVSSITVSGLTLGATTITATGTELNYCDVTTAGTAQASKAVILDASKDITGLNIVTATTLAGTLSTAAQANITSVGTLTGLTAATELIVDGTDSAGGILSLIEGTTSGTHKVSLQAPAGLAATYTLILPDDDGGSSEFLQTDGNGTLTWASGGASTIAGASDSSFSSLASNDVMKYNGSDWVNTKTISITTLSATTLNGTLGTAAQASVTSLGTLTGLTVDGNLTVADGSNNFDVASHDGVNGLKLAGVLVTTGASELNLLDGMTSNATELNFLDGTTAGTATASKALVLSSTKTIGDIAKITLDGANREITPSADGWALHLDAETFTDNITGISSTSSQNFSLIRLEQPTISASNTLVTTTAASTLYIVNAPAAGDNMTLSDAYALWVGAGETRLDGVTTIGGATTVDANLTVADGTNDFDVASHDGTNGLKLGGTLVTSTAAELNILDGVAANSAQLNYLAVAAAGTAEASKALIVDGSKDINLGTGDLSATDVTAIGNLVGTLSTAAQASITTIGTLSALTVTGTTSITGVTSIINNSFVLSGNRNYTPLAKGKITHVAAATYTDNSTSSSSVATSNFAAMYIDQPTVVATNPTVTTSYASTLYIANAPLASTNMTISKPYALWVGAGKTQLGGDVESTGQLKLYNSSSSNFTPTSSGFRIHLKGSTFTDNVTSAIGNASQNISIVKIEQQTIGATNATVSTSYASSLYIAGAPLAGTNMSLMDTYSLWVDAGKTRLDGDLDVTAHDGAANGLKLNGTLVTSTATELNYLDGVNSNNSGSFKGVILNNNGQLKFYNSTSNTYSPSTSGARIYLKGTVFTDTITGASSTSSQDISIVSIEQQTIKASNVTVTTSHATSLYIADAPLASTNMTLTDTYSLWVDAGISRLDGIVEARDYVKIDSGVVTQITTISTSVTLNNHSGVITTVSAATSAGTADTFTVSNTKVAVTDIVLANITNYAGTYGTNGFPVLNIQNVTTNAFDINIINVDIVNALSGALKIAFHVIRPV